MFLVLLKQLFVCSSLCKDSSQLMSPKLQKMSYDSKWRSLNICICFWDFHGYFTASTFIFLVFSVLNQRVQEFSKPVLSNAYGKIMSAEDRCFASRLFWWAASIRHLMRKPSATLSCELFLARNSHITWCQGCLLKLKKIKKKKTYFWGFFFVFFEFFQGNFGMGHFGSFLVIFEYFRVPGDLGLSLSLSLSLSLAPWIACF